MREEFQALEWAEPPVGDLVEKAVARGRRMRTARRIRIAGAGLAVLAVAGVATGLGVRQAGGTAPGPAPVAVAAPSAAATSAAPADEKRVKATPAGLLELLTQNLPAGKTGQYVGDVLDKDTVAVQLHLTRGGKTGVVLLDVINWKQPWTGTWTPLGPGVSYRVIENPGNCIQPTIVLVRHPGRSLLQFNLSTCTKHGPRTPSILTPQEAAQVGADPRWGVTVDPAINHQGAADFPHLSKNFG